MSPPLPTDKASVSKLIPPLESNVTVVPTASNVPSAVIVILAAAAASSVVVIANVPFVPTVIVAVSLVEPVIVITLPSMATSSTVRAVKVPKLVMLDCAAVATVPSRLATSVPAVMLRFPVSPADAVVVPRVHLSSDSSHIIKASLPVDPRWIIIPTSLELLEAPLFNSIKLSLIVVFVVSTVVVAPLTVKLPVIVMFPETAKS